jgi:hypothetical protein
MADGDDAQEVPADLLAASFVFTGVVLAEGAATMDAVPLDRGTLVVGVTETMRSPEQVGPLDGFEVTVQLQDQQVEVGRTYLFGAEGWLFGDGIAVVCTALREHSPALATSARSDVTPDPVTAIRDRTETAETILTGRVVQLREVARRASDPITEHDPQWCEAVIDVDSVVQGAGDDEPNRVTVRFAASRDASWVDAPKVAIGESAVFMLGQAEPERAELERSEAGARRGQYVLLRQADVLPIEAVETVRQVLGGQ